MSEQIETAEELDALPAGTVLGRIHPDGSGPNVYRLDPDMGWLMAAERVNAPSVDRVDWVGNDLGPLVVLYRPDAKPETTEDVVERAAEAMWGATCPDGLRAAMRPDTMVMARALAAAGLLRGVVTTEQREAVKDAIRKALSEASPMDPPDAELATSAALTALGLEVVDGE